VIIINPSSAIWIFFEHKRNFALKFFQNKRRAGSGKKVD